MRKEGEKEKKGIVWGKKSCKALHWEQENKGNQGCDGWTTWKNGPECRLKTYWRIRETEESGVDLSMKRPTLGSWMVEDKTRQNFRQTFNWTFQSIFCCCWLEFKIVPKLFFHFETNSLLWEVNAKAVSIFVWLWPKSSKLSEASA